MLGENSGTAIVRKQFQDNAASTEAFRAFVAAGPPEHIEQGSAPRALARCWGPSPKTSNALM